MACAATGPARQRRRAPRACIPNIARCSRRICRIWTCELVTVATPDGTTSRRASWPRAIDDDTACVSCSSRTSSAAWKRCEALVEAAHDAGALFVVERRSDQPGPAQAAGRLRRRHRRGRRAIAGQPDGVRRAVPGHHGLPREVRPPDAGPDRRPDGRPPRQALLGADAANPRAAHPPRKGDEQHLHQPRPVRPAGDRLSGRAGPAGLARGGRAVPAQSALRRRPADRSAAGCRWRSIGRSSRNSSSATATARSTRCWPRRSTPASSPACRSGSWYPELSDCLLVTVTEKRTRARNRRAGQCCAEPSPRSRRQSTGLPRQASRDRSMRNTQSTQLLFELSKPGRRAARLPASRRAGGAARRAAAGRRASPPRRRRCRSWPSWTSCATSPICRRRTCRSTRISIRSARAR